MMRGALPVVLLLLAVMILGFFLSGYHHSTMKTLGFSDDDDDDRKLPPNLITKPVFLHHFPSNTTTTTTTTVSNDTNAAAEVKYIPYPEVIELNGSSDILILTYYHYPPSRPKEFSPENPRFRLYAVLNQLCYAHKFNYNYKLESKEMSDMEEELGITLGRRKVAHRPIEFNWGKPLSLLQQAMSLKYEWIYWMDLDFAIYNFSVPLEYFLHTVPSNAKNIPLSVWENNVSLIAPGHYPGYKQLRSSTFAFLLKTGKDKVKDWRVKDWLKQWEKSKKYTPSIEHDVMDFLARWIKHDKCDEWQDQGAMWIEIGEWVRRTRDQTNKRYDPVCDNIVRNRTDMQCKDDYQCVEDIFWSYGYNYYDTQHPPYAAFWNVGPTSRAATLGGQAFRPGYPVFAKHKFVIEDLPPQCSPERLQELRWSQERVLELFYPTSTDFLEIRFSERRLDLETAVVVEIMHEYDPRGKESVVVERMVQYSRHVVITAEYINSQGLLPLLLAVDDGQGVPESRRHQVRMVIIHETMLTEYVLRTVWSYLHGGSWLCVVRSDGGKSKIPAAALSLQVLNKLCMEWGIKRPPCNSKVRYGDVWAVRKLYTQQEYDRHHHLGPR